MRLHRYLAFGVLCLASSAALAKQYCGELQNHYGPYDYRLRGQHDFSIVENAHFTEAVEQGVAGNTSYLGGDLDYTLRAIPNHHRALATLLRLTTRQKTVRIPHMRWPTECYFERAQRFAPDDAKVYALYGNYLMSHERQADALKAYTKGLELEPGNPTLLYNLGLLALRAKDLDKAVSYAEQAYGKGFPLPYLKQQLQEKGKWTASNDAAVQAAQAADAAASPTTE